MCVCLCVCVGGGQGAVCDGGEEVLETKLFFRRGVGSGSAAKGGPTEKVGIPYLYSYIKFQVPGSNDSLVLKNKQME